MLHALKLVVLGVPALLRLSSTVLAEFIANPELTLGDAEKGKRVYQRVGVCVNCHGWAGDGESGRNPVAHVAEANLREARLGAQGLHLVIRCGIPGTQMPYLVPQGQGN
jgi:cytochrome c553